MRPISISRILMSGLGSAAMGEDRLMPGMELMQANSELDEIVRL